MDFFPNVMTILAAVSWSQVLFVLGFGLLYWFVLESFVEYVQYLEEGVGPWEHVLHYGFTFGAPVLLGAVAIGNLAWYTKFIWLLIAAAGYAWFALCRTDEEDLGWYSI